MAPTVDLEPEELLTLTSLREIFGGFAHEMAQPLNAIMIAAQVMQLRAKKSLLPQAELDFFLQRLDLVSSQVGRATEILEGVRAFGQRERTAVPASTLKEIFQKIHGLMGQQFVSRGIDLQWEAQGQFPPMAAGRDVVESLVVQALGFARDSVQGVARWHEGQSLPYAMKLIVHLQSSNGSSVLSMSWDVGDAPLETAQLDPSKRCGMQVSEVILTELGGRLEVGEGTVVLTLPS